MNRNRFVLGLFGLALAAVFFIDALGYPDAAAQMPLIYSVTVGLLSLAMLGAELLRGRVARRRETEPVASGDAAGPDADADADAVSAAPRYAVTAAVFVLAAAYVATISVLGYLLSTTLFMALALLLIRTVSLRFALIGSLVLMAVVCLVFIQFLGLPVPFLPAAIA
ncbi:tripartite tricarboxylate transporter TctB family protein [Pseudomonas sp.]|uniref:tripartite tricarboxylate transporter TctB family protein n=1 Tax=Pseudomonas sp. TaxID=306 RepID=UPI0028A64555|nr:tripartite tricarboxylate transporter TctB family protein [Pseudomonas sp.]